MNKNEVLNNWKQDMEYNRANGQLAPEGEDILAALTKAVEKDIYSLEVSELQSIRRMADIITGTDTRSKAEIIQSLMEQNVPSEKIPEIVSQTMLVRKEAKFIKKILDEQLKKEFTGD